MFCVKSSRDIIAVLGRECEQANVETRLSCRVMEISRGEQFSVATDQGVFLSDSLVIATGGLSYAKLGASGFGHAIARQFGLKVVPPMHALVPFLFPGRAQARFKELAGISLDAVLSCGGMRMAGSTLFTHRGLSGPAALQASLYWTPGEPLIIDLLPSTDILGILIARRRSRIELRTLLAEHLPKRLAEML